LRRIVGEKSGRYFVVKNRTFAIAAKEHGQEELSGLLKGQVGIVFDENDSLDLVKAVVGFGKQNEELSVLGGFFKGGVRSAGEMLAIAAMPPKAVAAAELVGVIAGPVSEIVQVLSEVVQSFIFIIRSIGEEKERSCSE